MKEGMTFRFVLDKLLNNNKTKNNFPEGKWNSESTAAVIHDLKCQVFNNNSKKPQKETGKGVTHSQEVKAIKPTPRT